MLIGKICHKKMSSEERYMYPLIRGSSKRFTVYNLRYNNNLIDTDSKDCLNLTKFSKSEHDTLVLSEHG